MQANGPLNAQEIQAIHQQHAAAVGEVNPEPALIGYASDDSVTTSSDEWSFSSSDDSENGAVVLSRMRVGTPEPQHERARHAD